MSEVRLGRNLQRREASHTAEFLAVHDVPARLESGAAANSEPLMTAIDQHHFATLRQTARDLREFVLAIDRRMQRVDGPRERTIAVAAAVLRDEAIARIGAIEAELADTLIPVPPAAVD